LPLSRFAARSPREEYQSADTQTKHVTTSQARAVGIASAIWAVSIFLSRIMGLKREQIIGRTLGASRQADLCFASFTLPDFLNYLLAAGALSIVFIPIFLEYLQRGDDDRGWEAFSYHQATPAQMPRKIPIYRAKATRRNKYFM
jgi:hypothetical protein